MSEISNAQRLRQWLLGCEAIDPGKRFGVDWLGDDGEEYALLTAPSPLRWRENVLGQRRLLEEQEQVFHLVTRAHWGAGAEGSLDNLASCQAVVRWIMERNAAGDFPQWEGGEVIGVTPTLTGAPIAYGAGTARYQIQIKVIYRT